MDLEQYTCYLSSAQVCKNCLDETRVKPVACKIEDLTLYDKVPKSIVFSNGDSNLVLQLYLQLNHLMIGCLHNQLSLHKYSDFASN